MTHRLNLYRLFGSMTAQLVGLALLSTEELQGQGVPPTIRRLPPASAKDSVELGKGFQSESNRREALLRSSEPSHLTLFGNVSGSLLLEGNIAPHLFFTAHDFAIEATPKILLRMRNDESASVPAPSFMPRLSVHFWPSGMNKTTNAFGYFSLTLSHHSNGRSSPFYLRDSLPKLVIDTAGGSFSTNFVEATYTFVEDTPDELFALRIGGRAHIPWNEDPELRNYGAGADQYGRYRLLFSISGTRGRLLSTDSLGPFAIRIRFGSSLQYMVDKKVVTSRFWSRDRFVASLGWSFVPERFKDVGGIIYYYLGQDYHNILYKKRLSVWRVGLTVNAVSELLVAH